MPWQYLQLSPAPLSAAIVTGRAGAGGTSAWSELAGLITPLGDLDQTSPLGTWSLEHRQRSRTPEEGDFRSQASLVIKLNCIVTDKRSDMSNSYRVRMVVISFDDDLVFNTSCLLLLWKSLHNANTVIQKSTVLLEIPTFKIMVWGIPQPYLRISGCYVELSVWILTLCTNHYLVSQIILYINYLFISKDVSYLIR